jgi:hypothetical protein
MTAPPIKAPVSLRAVIDRLNRKLRCEDQHLHYKKRGVLGPWYIVNTTAGGIVQYLVP